LCFNCPDFIDQCFICGDPNGGPYEKAKKFYVGDRFCEHLAEQYGHDTTMFSDRYGEDEEE
jgi:hypothetical protein